RFLRLWVIGGIALRRPVRLPVSRRRLAILLLLSRRRRDRLRNGFVRRAVGQPLQFALDVDGLGRLEEQLLAQAVEAFQVDGDFMFTWRRFEALRPTVEVIDDAGVVAVDIDLRILGLHFDAGFRVVTVAIAVATVAIGIAVAPVVARVTPAPAIAVAQTGAPAPAPPVG